jgi:hypothetical protein
MATWSQERRADRVTAREQNRLDADAAVTRRAEAEAFAAELDATRKADDDTRRRTRQADADRRHQARRTWRTARRKAAGRWVAEHVVEALCYPLGAASAIAAVPAMASFGEQIYGRVTGIVLPVLSELGAWCFAFAVLASRRRHPDRPVVMLTAGVAVFAGIGAALNFIHGIETGRGLIGAVVMAIVSVAGVAAHQLAVASPPRSRAERADARRRRAAVRAEDKRARAEARTLSRARRRAVRLAVVELAPDGAVALLYPEGRWVLTRRGMAPFVDGEQAPAAGDTASGDESSEQVTTSATGAANSPEKITGRRPRRPVPTPRGEGRAEVARAYAAISADDPRTKTQRFADIAASTGLAAATVKTYVTDLTAPSADVAASNGAAVPS